ncbi:general secretion pathway protein GspB [Candidatus Auribacterota bacterium]
MSLIYEALQKAGSDAGKKAGFVKANAGEAEKKRKRNKLLLLAGLLCAVVIIGIVAAAFFLKTPPSNKAVPPPVEKKTASEKAEDISTAAAKIAPGAFDVPKAQDAARGLNVPQARVVPKAAGGQVTAGASQEPENSDVSIASQAQKVPDTPVISEAEPEEKPLPVETEEEIEFPESRPAVLNELKIGGIIEDQDSSMAIINGTVVSVGDVLRGGIKVKEIRENSVIVTIKGKDYTVYR